jgi:diguanylate cyclase (GGDEF)-like protein
MKNKRTFLLFHLIFILFIVTSIYFIFTKYKNFTPPLTFFLLLSIFTLIISFRYHYKLQKALKKLNQYNADTLNQQRMLRLQETMLELSSYMTKVNSLEELLDVILRKVIDVIPGAEYGSILVMNQEGLLEFKAIYGFEQDLFKVTLDPTECYQWRATSGNFSGPLIIQDLSELSKDYMTEETYTTMNEANALITKSALSAPLLINGQFFGSINIDSTKINTFKEEDIKLIAYFADQVTIAIRNHQYYEKMLLSSKYDSLTGAMSRHYFQEFTETILKEKQQTKLPLTIVIMDLNNFKMINDQYGHASGDFILTFFANSFSCQLSKGDFLGRYGGDEFVAIFLNSNLSDTALKLQSIYNNITKAPIPITPDHTVVHCLFSYGTAEFPMEGSDLKTLIHLADQRMYIHKSKLKFDNLEAEK